MALPKFTIDYATAVNIPLTTTSATVAIPANAQLIGITTDTNARFRVCPLALATAISSDPLLTPNSEIQIVKINGTDTNVAALAETGTGNMSVFRVYEG